MPTWLQIFLACGGSVLITSIVTGIIAYVKKQHAKVQEWSKEDRIEDMKDIIHEELQPIVQDLQVIKSDLALDKKATITSLRVTMKSLRDRFMNQGYADSGDKGSWLEAYDHYKEMGGNHFKEYVDQWKHDVESLPSHKEN